MAGSLPRCVDTVIVGNGPSALILSYILHGHIPYYTGGHHDQLLDTKLRKEPSLLRLTPGLYTHFVASLRYSTAALPVNTLLDTLIRPNADTEINPASCVEWRSEPERAVSHVVLGDTAVAGGQWADEPIAASASIGTLSYAEQLSLPGYSYAEHVAKTRGDGGAEQCDFVRPSRKEVAGYLAAYPAAVGIQDAVHTSTKVDNVYRMADGFTIGSLDVHCKHLVLASGIFTVNIPPPPLLSPLTRLPSPSQDHHPLLVIGSGFSAADAIISSPPARKIIHLYNWAPNERPSPLRGCHASAYPEYATVYRQMKLAALASGKSKFGPAKGKGEAKGPLLRRKSTSNPFSAQRDWAAVYEGMPNATILETSLSAGRQSAQVTFRLESGEAVTRQVGSLAYVVGRRGSLSYLSPALLAELDIPSADGNLISGRSLRARAESSLEVARDVFVSGSLAGDSLIRHAVGGCVFAAGRILGAIPPSPSSPSASSSGSSTPSRTAEENEEYGASASAGGEGSPRVGVNGTAATVKGNANGGHEDLHVDRRGLARDVEVATSENRVWVRSGWWAGGLGWDAAV